MCLFFIEIQLNQLIMFCFIPVVKMDKAELVLLRTMLTKFQMNIPEKIDVSCQNLASHEDSSHASRNLFAGIPFFFFFFTKPYVSSNGQ